MQKEQLLQKTKETLAPLETERVLALVKDMTFKTVFTNPTVLGVFALVLIYAIFAKSKFLLLFLFTILSLAALVRYTLPQGSELSVQTTLPFAFGCLAIGAVLLYFTFIRGD